MSSNTSMTLLQIKTTPRMESEVVPASRLTASVTPIQNYDTKKALMKMDYIEDELQQTFNAIGQKDNKSNQNVQRNNNDFGATREVMF